MINGILNIYKEKGYTSHDVVARLRRIVGQKKIGHTGTLDPDAEGVLPVCLGKATKVCDLLPDRDKTYETVLLLGKTTDTQDISGTVLEERETDGITPEMTEKCIQGFAGAYDQIPPMYSALKVNGRKLYELAREGRTVERKSRRVTIHRIQILDMKLPRVKMEVDCSKGTYIRTLCQDIGDRLGTGGCMEQLVRTRSGRFGIASARRLDEVQELAAAGKLGDILIPLDSVFEDLSEAVVSSREAQRAFNGNAVSEKGVRMQKKPEPGERCRIYDPDGHFIGIYQYDADKMRFELEKMFLDPEEIVSGRGN